MLMSTSRNKTLTLIMDIIQLEEGSRLSGVNNQILDLMKKIKRFLNHGSSSELCVLTGKTEQLCLTFKMTVTMSNTPQ
jgi:hypothetical protein